MIQTFQRYRVTCIFLCVLFLLSCLVHYGRVGASFDGMDLSSDVPTYVSIAAADVYPQAFVEDPVYDDRERYGVHATVLTSIIPFFSEDGNFGRAYLSATGVQFFLHGLAFYILGFVLLRKAWQGVIFAAIMSQTYWMPFGTYWGNGYIDYLPRSVFEIFYAFFIVVALYIRQKPRLWPFFMASIGLMVYVHSISTLPAAFGFWLGFAFYRPEGVSIRRHCLWLLFCGTCFMAVISPLILTFLRPGISLTQEDVSLFRDILALRYNIEFTHYWLGLRDFLIQYCAQPLLPLGLCAYFCLRAWGDMEEKVRAAQFLLWTAGVVFCVLLFLVDQELGFPFQRKPFEFDLVRVIRFFVFFAICLIFMACNVIYKVFSERYASYRRAMLCVYALFCLILFFGGMPHKLMTSMGWYWNVASEERFADAYASSIQRREILTALSEHTAMGDVIFDPSGDRAIRYTALRALAYSWFDCSLYYYAKDVSGLRKWYAMQSALKASPTAYMTLARESGADYLISRRPVDRAALQKMGEIVWESPYALLVKLL